MSTFYKTWTSCCLGVASSVTDHVVDTNHVISWKETRVIRTEDNKRKRCIREAIEIRKRKGHTMNRDMGQYHLSHVFDDLLSPKEKSLGDRTRNSETTKAVVVSRRQDHHNYSSVDKGRSSIRNVHVSGRLRTI